MLLSGLTWQGVASSWVLGTLTYSAFGPGGYAIVCAYFIVGSLVGAGRRWAGRAPPGGRAGEGGMHLSPMSPLLAPWTL